MAMLAEPRRKTKWSLNPRGKLWSEDSNKFGQKLLEKMGWTAGKGLGAKEQGITSHIHVQVKSDNTGVGFKGKDTDWCKHQAQFDEVLASLSQNMGGVGNHQPSESLEERSKASKARLHYQKFTRGKDVSKYSSKDLGCILGVPGEKLQAKSDEVLCPVEDIGAEDDSFGVKTVVGGSIEDYLNRKQGLNNQARVFKRKDGQKEGGCGKKRKGGGNRELLGTFEGAEGNEDAQSPNMGEEETKRKKKKKRSKDEKEGEVENISKPLACIEESEFHEGNLQDFSAEAVEKRECKPREKSSKYDSGSFTESSEKDVCGGSHEEGLPRSWIKKKKRKGEFSGRVMEGEAEENILSKEVSSEDMMHIFDVCNEGISKKRAGEEGNCVVKRKKKEHVTLEPLSSHVDEVCCDSGVSISNNKKSRKKKSSDYVEREKYYPSESFNADSVLESDTHVHSGSVKQVNEDEVRTEEVDISERLQKQVKKKTKSEKLDKRHYHPCLDSKECDSVIISSSCKMFSGANLDDIQGYGAAIEDLHIHSESS